MHDTSDIIEEMRARDYNRTNVSSPTNHQQKHTKNMNDDLLDDLWFDLWKIL